MPFNIIICGGGLGGLAAAIALNRKGHKVTVLEGASQLAEVGAGIQIPPNSSRILAAYGLCDEISKLVVWPQNIHFRRYCSGDVIGKTPLEPRMKDEYGYPYWLIHRADHQRCLWENAEKQGVEFLLNHYVDRVDPAGPSVTLANGKAFHADIIIGADGIRSKAREAILGDENVHAVDSSNCAYRATVPKELMLSDPERHAMAYPIRGGEMYNLVMSHHGKAAVGKRNEPGDLEEMRNHYANFDPVIRKVFGKVTSCLKWKLADLPPLPRWVSDNGRVVVMGDAAHAMVPYLAQGAATAIEDGVAFADYIHRARDVSDVPQMLLAFQEITKPHCEIIQAGSRGNGDIWHMPDGPEQEQRDRDMMDELLGREKEIRGDIQNPNRWSDTNFQPWLFGYDAIKEISKFLDKKFDPSL